MKTKTYSPLTPENYKNICSEWSKIACIEESGTQIWPSLNGAYRRIIQFFYDKKLQKELFKGTYERQIMVYVDLEQDSTLNKERVYQILKENIEYQIPDKFPDNSGLLDIIDFLTKKEELNLTFFVSGADAAIKNNNWQPLQTLNHLAERELSTHVLLFLETDVTHPDYISKFSRYGTLAQNISIVPLYTIEDAEMFIRYLCEKWSIAITKEQTEFIVNNCGGHFFIIKEIMRRIRNNSGITPEALQLQPTVQARIKAIIENLSSTERLVLLQAISNTVIPVKLQHEKHFLLTQGWIRESKDKVVLNIPILKNALEQYRTEKPENNYMFTRLERNIMDYFKNQPGIIVSREQLAKIIWDKSWEEKYSDWAIDQLIHKIRKKLVKTNSPYEILTKKGEGFIMLKK